MTSGSTEVHEIRGSFLTPDAEYEYWRSGDTLTLVVTGKPGTGDDSWNSLVYNARVALGLTSVITTQIKKRVSVLEVKVASGVRGSVEAVSAIEKLNRPSTFTWGGISRSGGTVSVSVSGGTTSLSSSIAATRLGSGAKLKLTEEDGIVRRDSRG